MRMQKVLLLGATGETGGSILNGLLDSGNFVSYFLKLYVYFLTIEIASHGPRPALIFSEA
jgi:hypothetical protein